MNNGLISVIIPAYNTGKYIKRCLKSITNQTYTKLEIIVVNDGSTDNTASIVTEMIKTDSRIVLINQENAGVTFARNTGINAANGEFIGFVDSDDEIEPEMYEILYNNAIEHDADISHCGYKKIFPDRVVEIYGTGDEWIQYGSQAVIELLKADKIDCGLCTKIFKKDLFDKVRLEKPVKHFEDLLLNYYLFSEAECSYFCDKTLYHYINREGSASVKRQTEADIEDVVFVMETIAEDCKGSIDISFYAERRKCGAYINLYNAVMCDKELSATQMELRKKINDTYRHIDMQRNRRIRAWAIVHVPFIYKMLQGFYSKFIGPRKKYYGC